MNAEQGMTAVSWAYMITVWIIIAGVTAYSFIMVFRRRDSDKRD